MTVKAEWEVSHIPLVMVLAESCNHPDDEPCTSVKVFYFPFGIMTPDEAASLALLSMLAGEKPKPKPQTLLCAPQASDDDVWGRTLNGDFRIEFEAIYGLGFDACVQFWESQRDDHGGVEIRKSGEGQ
jgi:hypothetical protein